jgi:hypothetical protein
LLLFLSCTSFLQAQEKKILEALYLNSPLLIDGVADEAVYSESKSATGFLQLQPYNGKPAYQPSEVHIFYDQTAIYVGAILYDSAPDSIFNFFSERDNIGMSDYFGIYFDPYNQGQLAYGFFITPAGVQTDIKAVKSDYDYEDGNWNAVWQSHTRINDKGWVVEMRIPYSAIRFPEQGDGAWGLNMFRNVRRYNSNSSWNFVSREVSGFIHQQGQLTGIKDIKPPVRLSLSPYGAAYSEFDGHGSPAYTYKGGLDLKFGISESFTLDMMLIPDFGQIQSDDKQLNLSPYELYYSEQRQFFTEGTELFERGNIFYSRRIGAYPTFSYRANDALTPNEVIDYSPAETQLINATKVSGRTTKGWGLGFLNAMTLPSYASLTDTITHEKRDVLIQPFTNYNVSVMDKSLKNNSYISLINTNMAMANDPFGANVTATDFQLRNRTKTYAVKGKGGVSTRGSNENETGFYAMLGLEKNSGKLQYGLSQLIYSDQYNPNDLGYLMRNNEMTTETYVNYNIIEPFGIFREMHATLWMDHIRSYKDNLLYGNDVGFNYFTQFMNNYGGQLNFRFSGERYDYYEPRVPGRYYLEPRRFHMNFYAFSDRRKPVSLSMNGGATKFSGNDQYGNFGELDVAVRIGRRFQFFYSVEFENQINDRGFVDMTESEDTIYFARRDVNSLENVFNASYAFTNKMSMNLRARHYWSGALNKTYYQLQPDGLLETDPAYMQNNDENYNAFNVDLIFRWIFAPGSELTIAWKNSILESQDNVVEDYWRNLSNTWNADQINSFSVKILYYIDYNNLRKKG